MEGCEAVVDRCNECEGGAAEIKVSAGVCWPAVVNATGDAEAVGWVGKFDIGVERKGWMCTG